MYRLILFGDKAFCMFIASFLNKNKLSYHSSKLKANSFCRQREKVRSFNEGRYTEGTAALREQK